MQHYVVGKWHNPFIYESRCFYWIFLLSLLNLYNTFIMVYQIFLIYFKTSTSIFIKNSIKKRNKKEKKWHDIQWKWRKWKVAFWMENVWSFHETSENIWGWIKDIISDSKGVKVWCCSCWMRIWHYFLKKVKVWYRRKEQV